jgi:hypothetical protein
MTDIKVSIADIPLSIKGAEFYRSLNPIEKKLLSPFVINKTQKKDESGCLNVRLRTIPPSNGFKRKTHNAELDTLIRQHFGHRADEKFEEYFPYFLKDTLMPYLKAHPAYGKMLLKTLRGEDNENRILIQKRAFVVCHSHGQSYEVVHHLRDHSTQQLCTYHLAPVRLLFRMLMNSEKASVMLHASSMEHDGWGYVFLGQSNTGKSTVVKLLEPERILSDDTTIIRKIGKKYRVYPNPWWNGHANLRIPAEVSSVPLKAIFFINKAKKTEIKRLNYREALCGLIYGDRIFQQAGFFDNRYGIRAYYLAAQELIASIPAFRLNIAKGPEFKQTFYRYLDTHLE